MRIHRGAVAASLFVAALVLLAWRADDLLARLPPGWNPRAPLTLADPPTPVTRWKLARTLAQPAACQALLATSGFRYTPLPDRDTGAGCGFRNAVRIERMGIDVGAPFSVACPTAVALAMWESQVLQPAAREMLGSRVRRLEHFGSYACRGVYGREDARRSSHATAEALDLAGVVLEDGRRLRVRGDYAAAAGSPSATAAAEGAPPDPDAVTRAAFLRALREGACRHFRVVLGPEYNAAHRDHFHLETRGPYAICR
jgi:hypothetical protein